MTYEVNLLMKNVRYRIIQMGDEYYLLDTEKSIWLLFMPILLWLIPHKIYKINTEIADGLRALKSYFKGTKSVTLFGAAVLTTLVQPLLDEKIDSTVVVNVLLLMIITILVIFLRLYIRKYLGNKISRTVVIDRLETKTIRIWP